MLRKAWVIYGKEMRVMARDRRMVMGMAVSALVVYPLLMGFIGNIDRIGGADGNTVAVVTPVPNPELRGLLSGIEGVELHEDGADLSRRSVPFVTVIGDDGTFTILADGGDGAVWGAARRIEDALSDRRQELLDARLAERGIRLDEMAPFRVSLVDTSTPRDQTSQALAFLVPYLAVILLVTNAVRAVYIAVGEKERNTLASLLVSTVPRPSIVIGKSLAIMTFSVAASVLLIAGMVIFAAIGFTVGDVGSAPGLRLRAAQVLQLGFNLAALALLISSMIMIIGTWARSQREAGMYTAPIIFLSLFLAIFALSPQTFPGPVYAVPILGNALAMKDTILGTVEWGSLMLPLAGNLSLFALLTYGSVRLYRRESVLFRA